MNDLYNHSLSYFIELNRSQLSLIDKISKTYNCSNGDSVFLQGEYAPYWVIILKGSFLCRVKDEDDSVREEILFKGDSFDFKSTISRSITSSSMEALEDSAFLLISRSGLKELSKKKPVILSLIKEQFSDTEAYLWDEYIFKKDKKKDAAQLIKKSKVWSILKISPLLLIIIPVLWYLKEYRDIITLISLLAFIVLFLNSRLVYLEISMDAIVKKEFRFGLFSVRNSSIPINNIGNNSVTYRNGLCRLFKIGKLTFKSSSEDLELNGVYKPDMVLKRVDEVKNIKLDIDKALEVSSFRNIFSRKNNSFSIDNSFESESLRYEFKKSIFYFLVRSVPQFLIFLLTSTTLTAFFSSGYYLLLNIPTLLFVIWNFLDWSNDRYIFENGRLIDIEKKPLWGKEVRTIADLQSVESVTKEQKNIFQILFNYGDIKISTISGELKYFSIKNPGKVIENLYLVKKYYQSEKENLEKQQRQEEFLDYTKQYQELSGE